MRTTKKSASTGSLRKRTLSSNAFTSVTKKSKKNAQESSPYESLSQKQVNVLKELLLSRTTSTEIESNENNAKIIQEVFPDQMSASARSVGTFLDDVRDVFEKCVKQSSKSKHWNIVNFGNGASYNGFSTCSSLMQYFGVYSWSDGHHYMGRFKNCNQHSLGYYSWPSKGKFFGFWKKDEMDGLGIYMSRDSVIYYGRWKNDMQHGEGIKIVPAKVNWGKNKITTVEQVFFEKWKDQKLLHSRQVRKHLGGMLDAERKKGHYCDVEIVFEGEGSDSEIEIEKPLDFTLRSSPRKSFLTRLQCSTPGTLKEEDTVQSPYQQEGPPRSPFGLMRNE
eukprot:CAMPEP_0117436582 /NCGR_PEP_ID=MMETSP0759-20121206/1082_1 /TAXON_ID=63605 /ORGANISM="Percolomonas cosmopolitus, Strain WS" /LENGTH=333 /DNA_ID=CAMNT_0005228187 /DNA_START=322 /DNA_END=1323 /DNA_ORIENTATION=+